MLNHRPISFFAGSLLVGLFVLFVLLLIAQPALLFAADLQQSGQATGETFLYTVQRGDTLYAIARRFNTTVTVLVRLNNLSNPNLIFVGQKLKIPVGGATPTPTPTPTATGVWTNPPNAIELFSPVQNGLYHSPIEVIGFSQTFEGNVNIRLKDNGGAVLAERNATGGSVDGFAFFHSYVRFTVTEQMTGTLEVFETSAKDGSEIHKVTIPLTLLAGQRVIDVNRPQVGAAICNPVFISGYSNTFEATLVVDLSQRNGTVVTSTSVMGGNLGVYADFLGTLNHPVVAPQPMLVSAYEGAASGLGLNDQTRIPVSLYPPGSAQCP